jgi:hypothetical protein
MNASSGSWVVRQVQPFIESSAVAGVVRRVLRARQTVGVRRVPSAPPPLTYQLVASSCGTSRLAAMIRRGWHTFASAMTHSRTYVLCRAMYATLAPLDVQQRVALLGWAVAVGAVTHLVMLLAVEQYHFPRRATLVLPAAVAIVATLTAARSRDVARAISNRRRR